MNCDDALSLISAQIDGEITPEDRAALEAHLTTCAGCRAADEVFHRQHTELRQAFGPRRQAAVTLADRVIAQVHVARMQRAIRPRRFPLVLSAAAGFIVALILLRPWQESQRNSSALPIPEEPISERNRLAQEKEALNREKEELAKQRQLLAKEKEVIAKAPPPEPVRKPLVHLTVATGVIEMLLSGQQAWQPLATGGALGPGARVRTGPKGRCEFRTPEGSEIRLNGNTELTFHTHRKLELARGQVWSSVVKDPELFQVQVPVVEATVTALGTQFDIDSKPAATLLTVLQGSTKVAGQAGEQVVKVGERVRILKGTIAEKNRVFDPVVATSWVHEILVLKGRDNEELKKRMNDMLAQIGETKMSFMYEKEILALGDHCVMPLTRFLQSERSKKDAHKRSDAARILAKIAQPWSVPDLIKLLEDDQSDVRFHAARALERLTEERQGLAPEKWLELKRESRQQAIKKWQTWWEQHKERYPTNPYSSAQ